MVIRSMSHGDLLLPDAPAEFAVSELDGAERLSGRLFLKEVRHMTQEPGGAVPHRRWGRGVMVTERLDRRSAVAGRRNDLRGHWRGTVDMVIWSRRVRCTRDNALRNDFCLLSQPHRFFDHDIFDTLEFLLLRKGQTLGQVIL